MYHWQMTRYRSGAFLIEQRATCRKCNEPLFFQHGDTRFPERSMTGMWLHVGQTFEDAEKSFSDRSADYHRAAPKEFCEESVTVNDYDTCGRPVKYEDVAAANYACGFHMKGWLEQLARSKRNEQEREAHRQRELREAFEMEQYTQAALWINEHGFHHLIGDYKAKGRYRGFDRTAQVDVFVLKEFLEGVVERLASNATDS